MTNPRTLHPKLSDYTPAEESLPYWSRSTNPIVRRHLGLYWRTLPPELRPILWIVLGWGGVIALNMLIPSIANYTIVTVVLSLVIMPVAVVFYAHILFSIASKSAEAMQEERRNNTLNLLMATPMSLPQILLGKVASTLWRRMEDWVLVNYAVALTSAPLFYTLYSRIWAVDAYPLALPVAVMGGVVVSLLRLMVEPIMVGVIGVFVGTVTPYRNTAISLSVALSLAYFGLLWGVGRLPFVYGEVTRRSFTPPNHGAVLALDMVLPIILPVLISVGLLKLSAYLLTKD